jgi:hypothetical protein
MKLHRIASTIAALALTAGLAGTASASSEAALQFGASAHVAPVAYKHCFPLFGIRRVHFSSSSRMVLVRKIIGWKCLPIAIQKPRLPIPDPGPYHKRPGKIGGLVNPQAGR